MFSLLFLVIGAHAITYDEMKEFNCYTPRIRENSRDLRCGVAISEHEQCEEMCRTAETIARRDSNPGSSYKGLLDPGEQLCEITFSGRCTSKTFRRNEDDLCFTINTKARGYNEAVEDCEDNGGSLYVPNSDNDLRKLINLTDSKISKFWFGGGSIFFRTCRDPSMGRNEEVAVQYIITNYDDRFMGYATTRITSDKAPYICAIPRHKKSGSCLSFPKPTTPTTTTEKPTTKPTPTLPPKCSFKYQSIGGGFSLWEACFPDGPLRIGDKVVLEGVQPSCCLRVQSPRPDIGRWSINLLSSIKAPLLHLVTGRDMQPLLFTAAPNGWGHWEAGRDRSYPNPFTLLKPFKIEITNTANSLAMIINGRSYTYGHVCKNPGSSYYSIGMICGLPDFKFTSIAVIRKGKRTEIGLHYLKFAPNLYT